MAGSLFQQNGCKIIFVETERKIFYKSSMGEWPASKKERQQMMLGFIVRRCAADLGHAPSPDEFAAWANEQKQNGRRYCLFGKPISAAAAKIMISQPGRLVTIRPEAVAAVGKAGG
jgi:hypothetical protein